MPAFIFQSIGSQELILIGIIALIFLGPRKLPEYARKIAKVMADLRSTTSEFRTTWEREVNFEEEASALKLEKIEEEARAKIKAPPADALAAPSIREVSEEEIASVRERAAAAAAEVPVVDDQVSEDEEASELDKRNWL